MTDRELLECLTDRPCDVCKFHEETGCSQWVCVFCDGLFGDMKSGNETSGDLISRQAVLDGLASIAKAKAKSDAQKSLIGRVMFFTEHLPSVNPQEPKTGHWIFVDDIESECSECGHREPNERFIFEDINFCARCGARMESEG